MKPIHQYHYQTFWQVLAFALLISVFIVSLMPTEKLPQVGSDKVAHFLTYAVLATSWGLAFISKSQITKLKILLFLIACGGVIEILQGLSGYRYAEWADFLANTLGVFLGALLASTIAKQWLFFIDQRLVKLLDKK